MNQDTTHEPLTLEGAGNTDQLRNKIGPYRSLTTRAEISSVNAKNLLEVERRKAVALTDIAITDINVVVTEIKTAMVGEAMATIGALTTRLLAATAATDQALTNAAAAEVFTHLQNRTMNVKAFDDMVKNGTLTRDERDVVAGFSNEDMTTDILRGRQRQQKAKAAVDALHSCALEGIEQAKKMLKA